MEIDVLEVCRLCLSKDGLIWLFDAALKMPQNVLDVVQVTTGVKILKTDQVSQKICSKCCQITLKMYQFRTNALKHDKYLKNKIGQIEPTTSPVIINICDDSDDNKSEATIITGDVHPSVLNLQQEYSNLKLPTEFLSKNWLPTIELKKFNDDGKNTFAFARKRTTSVKKRRYNIIDSDDEACISNTENSKQRRIEKAEEPSCDDNNSQSSSKDSDKTKSALKETATDAVATSDSTSIVNPFKDTSANISTEPAQIKFQNYFKSIGLVPSEKDKDLTDPMIVEKSEVILMCSICNKIAYSKKTLKNHILTHKKCRLCKIRFAGAHLIRCPILKDIEARNAQVTLTRVDSDKKIVDRYPSAFTRATRDENVVEEPSAVLSNPTSPQITTIEEQPAVNIQFIPNNINLVDVETSSSTATYPAIDQQGKRISSGLVKPDIKIKNDDFNIDLINPRANDIKIIKDLLKLRSKNSAKWDFGTQTYMSDNCNLDVNTVDQTCKFSNLKHQLYSYKLPIEIEYGDSLSVSIKSNEKVVPKRDNATLNLWGPSVQLKQKSLLQVNRKLIPVPATELNSISHQIHAQPVPKTIINAQPQISPNFAVQTQSNLATTVLQQQQPTIIWQTNQNSEQATHMNLLQNSTVANSNNLLTSASTSAPVQSTSFIIQHPSGQMSFVTQPANAGINLSNLANMAGNQQLLKLRTIPTINPATIVAKTNASQAPAKPKILNFLLSQSDVRPAPNTGTEINLDNILNTSPNTTATLPTQSNTITPKIVDTRSLAPVSTTNSTVSVFPAGSSSATSVRNILPKPGTSTETPRKFIRVKSITDLR